MRPKLRVFWRYRPRLFTLFLLLVIGALLVLANLSDEYHPRRAPKVLSEADLTFDVWPPETESLSPPWLSTWSGLSKGWPLLWNQYVGKSGYGVAVGGWRYSAGRLACNVKHRRCVIR